MLGMPEGGSLTDLGVTWTGQLRREDKLSPQIEASRGGVMQAVIEFHNDVDPDRCDQILVQGGLSVIASGSMRPNQRLVRGNKDTLRDLGRWDEVAYVFPASPDLAGVGGPRPCAGALLGGLTAAQYVTIGNGWAARGAYGVALDYVFTTLTGQVPASQVQTEIERAMHAWTAVTNVQFSAGVNAAATATVAIEFGTSVNGDPTPFDPSGTILAHTYYPDPPNAEPIAGDMHFNPAETWNVGASTDIYTVALHELGHALGLGHTDNPADVMYPYYRFGAQLSPNDIAGVQALYGAPGAAVPAPTGGGPNPGDGPVAPVSPLSLVISAPMNGMWTQATSTALSGTLVNATGPATVVWRASSGASGNASGSPAWTTTAIPLNPGINLITITATDGPQQSAAALLRILQTGAPATVPPTTPPPPAAAGVAITAPLNGLVTTASSTAVSGTASDPSGVAQVTWISNSGASGTASGTLSWSIPSVTLYPGQNEVIVYATGNSGGKRWSAVEITRN